MDILPHEICANYKIMAKNHAFFSWFMSVFRVLPCQFKRSVTQQAINRKKVCNIYLSKLCGIFVRGIHVQKQ